MCGDVKVGRVGIIHVQNSSRIGSIDAFRTLYTGQCQVVQIYVQNSVQRLKRNRMWKAHPHIANHNHKAQEE